MAPFFVSASSKSNLLKQESTTKFPAQSSFPDAGVPRAMSRTQVYRQPTGVVGHGSEDASHGQYRQAAYMRLRFAFCEGDRTWAIKRKPESKSSILFPWK